MKPKAYENRISKRSARLYHFLSRIWLVLQKSRFAPSSRELLGQDRRHAIHHQQQRLLLLHHADHCKQESGRCTASPHCAAMRKLWEHIKECNAPTCADMYCASSRHIWSHYGQVQGRELPSLHAGSGRKLS